MLCCEIEDIDRRMDHISSTLGFEPSPGTDRNVRAIQPEVSFELSDLGKRNLLQFLSQDYEIYETCQIIAKKMEAI